MAERSHKQRPIPVNDPERRLLEDYKRQYENRTGNTGDWGDFLGAIALLGLAAMGIYALANATRQTPQSVQVHCPTCQNNFIMAVPNNSVRVANVRCPSCQSDLVVRI